MKKTIILSAAFASAAIMSLTSCEKEIKFNGKQQETSIVLFSLARPGQEMSATVRQSAFILDKDGDEKIRTGLPDAKVNAFIGESREPVPFAFYGDNGNDTEFTCGYLPRPGDRIRIEAEADGFRRVRAETLIPQPAKFEIESIRKEKGESDEEVCAYIKIRIDDPAGEKNFYRLNLSRTYELDNNIWTSEFVSDDGTAAGETSIQTTSSETFYSNDPIFQKSNSNILGFEFEQEIKNYFTDSHFDGKSYTFEVYFSFFHNSYITTTAINVELTALSKSCYEYTASLDAYYESDDFTLFSEPVQILCNIENGIGYFGAETPAVRSVPFE